VTLCCSSEACLRTWCLKTSLERRAPHHLTLFTAIMCDPAPEVERFSCACTVCHVGEPSTHGSDLRFITILAVIHLLNHRCSELRTVVEHMLLLLLHTPPRYNQQAHTMGS
jgi:hypothetical protein